MPKSRCAMRGESMKIKLLLLFLIVLFPISLFAQGVQRGKLNIAEEDGSPTVFPYKLKVTNTTLTDNGDGTASLDIPDTASDIPIADSGSIITGTNVETALQENRTAIDLNTAADLDIICERGADFQNASDSTTAFQIHDADGGVPVLNIDTINERVGIGTATPRHVLDVAGHAHIKDNLNILGDGTNSNRFNLYTGNNDLSGTYTRFQFIGDYLKIDVVPAVNNYISFPNNDVGIGTVSPNVNLDVEGSTGISIGEDKAGGTSNDEGILKLWSDGDNAFYSQFKTGVQTENIGYILPLAKPTNNGVLQSTNTGVQSWIPNVVFKSFSATTQGLGASPDIYLAGFYEAPAIDSNLTQAGTTQTYGTATKSQAAHAFLVAAAAGTATGGSGAVTIVVSGISITDAGVRNASDTEVIVSDITAMTTDAYYETSKKWLGQVTYTLTVGATGHTAYAADFNYGFCKYDDCGNRDFKITDFECVGFAGANDTDLDIIIYHHSSAGWTYSAAAFVSGGTVIAQLNTDHSTDDQLVSGEHFAYKRDNLTTSVAGSGSEGFLVKVSSSANNAIEYINVHIGSEL